MEGHSYKGVIKQLQFIIKNDTCIKKQMQETTKESEVMNNKNTHECIQTEVNVIFKQTHTKKVIKMFGEIDMVTMIKQLKQLD